jgi:hypothetical protein
MPPSDSLKDLSNLQLSFDSYMTYKIILLIVLLLLLWNFVKNYSCGNNYHGREGMIMTNFSGLPTKLYTSKDPMPTEVLFVSDAHDYWPPYTMVALDEKGTPEVLIHDSKAGYAEQLRKFR